MREIKFRAWDLLSKSMRRVSFIEFDAADQICNVALPAQGVSTRKGYSDRFEERAGGEYLDLMQFTGIKELKGENDKEIYEGDVIEGVPLSNWQLPMAGRQYKDSQYKKFVVKWHYGRWVAEWGDTNATIYSQYNLGDLAGLRVIGNIYSNPELLTNTN